MSSRGREGDNDEATGIHYPSPGAENMDAGPFYNSTARDGASEHPDPSDPHSASGIHTQDQEQSQVSGQEPSTPQQHASRPANLAELRLAAELGGGLASATIMSTTDPSMNVDDPTMHNIMSHPDSDQQHTPSYVQDTPSTDHMVPHSVSVSGGQAVPPHYQMADGIPPRKRSKVSRACDECRRKKIKCDAQSDSGDNPCSSCARSSIRCLFSRVPQKRGPSKGYIKELADRIHSIENKLEAEGNLSQDDIDKLFVSDRSRSLNNLTAAEDAGRKRPFSSISSADLSTPASARQAPWGSESKTMQPPSASSDSGANHANNGNHSLAPVASAIKLGVASSKPPVASMDASMVDIDEVPEVDDGALQNYLTTFQSTYPILPGTLARVHALQSHCPPSLKAAFSMALTLVGSDSSEAAEQASALLIEVEASDGPRNRMADIVHAQTLLLLMIDAEWRASATFTYLLGRAVALANNMKLWRSTVVESTEPDSDDQLSTRIWWSLILLDRWHAAGTGKPVQIPDSSVVAGPGLPALLGDTCFHLTRLSKLLNRIAQVTSGLQPGSTAAEPSMAAMLGDYVEDYREDLPPHVDADSEPLIHLAYWHCRMLVTLLTPGATASELMWPTRELIGLLANQAKLRLPLVRHAAALAAMSLRFLSGRESTREEARQLLKQLSDELTGGQWDGLQERLANWLRPTSSAEATASQGLQHLADLATAHEALAPGEGEAGPGPSLASGYLDF